MGLQQPFGGPRPAAGAAPGPTAPHLGGPSRAVPSRTEPCRTSGLQPGPSAGPRSRARRLWACSAAPPLPRGRGPRAGRRRGRGGAAAGGDRPRPDPGLAPAAAATARHRPRHRPDGIPLPASTPAGPPPGCPPVPVGSRSWVPPTLASSSPVGGPSLFAPRGTRGAPSAHSLGWGSPYPAPTPPELGTPRAACPGQAPQAQPCRGAGSLRLVFRLLVSFSCQISSPPALHAGEVWARSPSRRDPRQFRAIKPALALCYSLDSPAESLSTDFVFLFPLQQDPSPAAEPLGIFPREALPSCCSREEQEKQDVLPDIPPSWQLGDFLTKGLHPDGNTLIALMALPLPTDTSPFQSIYILGLSGILW